MQTFSFTFGEEALLLDGFPQDIDSRNHAINPSRLEKNQTFKPLPSWCTMDDMTNKHTDRQTLQGCGTYRILRILSVIKELHSSQPSKRKVFSASAFVLILAWYDWHVLAYWQGPFLPCVRWDMFHGNVTHTKFTSSMHLSLPVQNPSVQVLPLQPQLLLVKTLHRKYFVCCCGCICIPTSFCCIVRLVCKSIPVCNELYRKS